MSTELKDMIIECLENNGCLPKMKAQLRASMFLLLHEDNNLSSLQPLMNKIVKELISTPEGKIMFGIVYEFLQFCGLDCTLSVLECESYLGQNFAFENREKITEELGLRQVNGPLLLEMVRSFRSRRSIPEEKTNGYHVEESQDDLKPQMNVTFDKSNPQILEKIPEMSTPKEDTTLKGNCSVNSTEKNQSKDSQIEESKSNDIEKSKKSARAKIAPLPDLSPVQHKPRVTDILPPLYGKEFKGRKNSDDLDKMFDMETEYEEDFICSGDDLSYVRSDISKEDNSEVSSMLKTSEANSVQKNIPETRSDYSEKIDSESIEENIEKSETEL